MAEMADERTESVRGADLARVLGRTASVAIALAPTARAFADEPCARVTAPGGLSPSWAGALDELRRQIALLPPADCQPMSLSIESSGEGVRVVAIASDGRRAEREVRHAASLVATALGLLMSIPEQGASPPAAQAPSAQPTPAQTPSPLPPSPPATVLPPGLPSPARGRDIALWTGLSAGLRLTAPSSAAVIDVEARADVLIDRWLLLGTIRSALVSCLASQSADCDIYNDVSLGIGVGRRIHAGAAAVDLALEPSIVAMHMEYDTGSAGEAVSVQGTEVALRLDASARLSVPVGHSWTMTLTMDGGVAPALLARPIRLEVPAGVSTGGAPPTFPPWIGGLRLGASGALL